MNIVVDVFTTEPLAGNALAAVPDGFAFDAATMQTNARELNLAETAFVLPATRDDCAVRVRFTPARALAFCDRLWITAIEQKRNQDES
jgi:trans-2,3-dihydro-3-hydroxyanthranilate isomerase